MTFIASTALWWAALAVPVIGLYVLRVHTRRVAVPTVMFWDLVFDRRQERFPWHRFRHFRSLLLQLLVLALFVLAVADPVPVGGAGTAPRVVVVIDTSGSMSANDETGTRLDRAKEAAERAAEALGRRHEVAVVTAGGTPSVLQEFTSHPPTVRRAIRAATPTDGPTRVDAALATARRMLGEGGRIVVVTDLCFPEAPRRAAEPDVTVIPIGHRVGNVGITRFQPRRSPIDPQVYEVLVELANWSDEPVTVEFDLELDGNPVDAVRHVAIPPNGQWSKVLTEQSRGGGGGVLTGRLGPTDALPADNVARALLPDRKPRRVVLVADRNQPGAGFLELALRANPLVDLDDPVPALTREPDPAALHVFYQRVPDRLPTGGVLVVDPANGCDLWESKELLTAPVVVGDQRRGARQLAYVRLDGLILPTARKIVPKEGVAVQSLVSEARGDLLYGAFESEGRRVLALAINPAFGELPLRAAFPILVANALEWLAGDAPEVPEPAVAGFPASVPLPGLPPRGELWLWPPEGSHPRPVATAGLRQDRPGAPWRVPVGELDRAGVWRLTSARADENGRPPAALAVLPCAPAVEAEGDLRPPVVELNPPFWEAAGPGRPIWVWLLGAALVLLVVEWWGYQRRWVA